MSRLHVLDLTMYIEFRLYPWLVLHIGGAGKIIMETILGTRLETEFERTCTTARFVG